MARIHKQKQRQPNNYAFGNGGVQQRHNPIWNKE